MRILIVNNEYLIKGGTDNYVILLYKLLIKKGHEVFLYKENSSSINSLKKKLSTSFNLFFSKNDNLYKLISSYKPDICHINNIFPLINFSIIKICKEKKIPVIQTIHDFRYINLDGIYDRKYKSKCLFFRYVNDIFKRKYHNSYLASLILGLSLIKEIKNIDNIDYFIFPNKFSRNIFKKYFNIKGKHSILPHFVSYHKITNFKKSNFFIYVGRISREKGIYELVNVFKTLPNLNLKVIGKCPLTSRLKLLKSPNIEFLDYVSDREKYKLLKSALFCVIPSKVEELGPLVLIESFMCGTPVIVPDFFSFKEKVGYGRSGLFYKRNSVLSLKKTIIRAKNLAGSKFYKNMTKFVRAEFFKKYHEDKYYNKLKKIYDQVLKK